MSEFTSALGNKTDMKEFISNMETTLNLLQQAVPENNEWNRLYRLWIDNAMSSFLNIIKKYSYLTADGIEEISKVIEEYYKCRPTADRINIPIPEEVENCIEKLKMLVDNMLTKYRTQQEQEEKDRMSKLWKATLESISTSVEKLKKLENPDFSAVSRIKEIASELQKEASLPEQSDQVH